MGSKDNLKKTDQNLRKLSLSIGNFIRYWGFRRIHGAIWTQLYLSKTALGCTELAQNLGLSKALISPALDELCSHKLIYEAPSPNQKSKVYQASDDINEVIMHVLKTRESKMLKQITQDFANFKKEGSKAESTDPARLKSMGEMILNANLMLELMLAQNDLLKPPSELKP